MAVERMEYYQKQSGMGKGGPDHYQVPRQTEKRRRKNDHIYDQVYVVIPLYIRLKTGPSLIIVKALAFYC